MIASATIQTDAARGAPSFEDVRRLLEEYGVEIVDKGVAPKPRQTRSPKIVQRIWEKHGEGHIRLVVATICETSNSYGVIDETLLWAVSDLVRGCRQIVEDDVTAWLELWDAIPVGQLQRACRDLYGITRMRETLTGMLYERIVRRFGPGAAQPDLYDDRGPYGETA